ncbi:hypothetical protein P8C59_006721 [Phyllachora maydis]|uniref:Uncharacterized protein n=1 Tax=Phyllachora maydis TaxID=1825666 RepID=A0AAD9MFT7_9PEZI|nr:hypothetical protein P8C59_006721 [Phyllachora maydis]
MFNTRPLSSFKDIFPSIHQPLPLNKKEAEHLLATLTASFRKNLDREHGWPPPETNNHPVPLVDPKNEVRRPTDHHLRAVLSNPLFARARPPARDGGLGDKPRAAIFDEAVARGLMTIPRAHGFLLANKQDARQGPHASVASGMAASGAGRRVVQWLQSSGLERDLAFVTPHERFTHILVSFMLAEGLEDWVWSWLDRLLAAQKMLAVDEVDEGLQSKQAPTRLLLAIINAKAEDVKLHAAFAAALKGQESLDARSMPSIFLWPAWNRVEWKATVQAWRHELPSEELFDGFRALRHRFGTRKTSLQSAHLNLHHPSNPDARRALEMLRREKWPQQLEAPQSSQTDRKTRTFLTKIMSMGLDTVQVLSRQGKLDEAQDMFSLLQSNFGEHFQTLRFAV